MYGRVFVSSGKLVMFFSTYLGIIYQKLNYYGQTSFTTFEYDTEYGNLLKHTGRLFLYLGMFLTPIIIGWLILIIIRECSDEYPNLIPIYFILYFIPNLISGFVCFAFGDSVCLKLGLYKQFLTYRTEEGSVDRRDSAWQKDYYFNPETQVVETF